MGSVRKVKLGGFIKWRGDWYQAISSKINAFIGKYVYVDDCFDGTLDLYTCAWLRKSGKQFVYPEKLICVAK